MTTTQPTKAPIDIQAEQMADEFIAGFKFCIWSSGHDLRMHYAQSVKPLLQRLHDQATQLTLAQCFASENEHLKSELAELKAAISTPEAVHANILRGTIPLTREQALHIAGANDYDALKQRAEELEAEINRHKNPDACGEIGDTGIAEDCGTCTECALQAASIEAERLARRVDELERTIEGLRNNTPDCGACAELLWTGMTLHQHTCGITKPEVIITAIPNPTPEAV